MELRFKVGDRIKVVEDEAEATLGTSASAQHYIDAAFQPIQFMQAVMTPQQFIGWLAGNVIKYQCRKDKKGQRTSDVNKARQYAYWLMLAREGKVIDPVKDAVPDEWEYDFFAEMECYHADKD